MFSIAVMFTFVYSEKSQTVITKDPTKHTPSIQGNGNADTQLDVQTKPDQSNTLDDVDVTEQLIRQKVTRTISSQHFYNY